MLQLEYLWILFHILDLLLNCFLPVASQASLSVASLSFSFFPPWSFSRFSLSCVQDLSQCHKWCFCLSSLISPFCPLHGCWRASKNQATEENIFLRYYVYVTPLIKNLKDCRIRFCFPPMEVCYQHVELFLIVCFLCAFLAGSMWL